MSHCQACRGKVYQQLGRTETDESPEYTISDCPGCGHEAEIVSLTSQRAIAVGVIQDQRAEIAALKAETRYTNPNTGVAELSALRAVVDAARVYVIYVRRPDMEEDDAMALLENLTDAVDNVKVNHE